MKRVADRFRLLRRSGRCGLVAYVTCGDPDLATTPRIVEELERAGADAIELGFPFSDPIADGPVIQRAAYRALQKGTTLAGCLRAAKEIRHRSDLPLIAFSYLNPILRYGVERFADEAAEAGIDSVLLTDLPPESAKDIRSELRRRGLGMIHLLAPTSTEERTRLVARKSDGFVYYVSTRGVTGARQALDFDLVSRLDRLREQIRIPLAVGFGVSTREQVQLLAPHCDAVVVGSAIVAAVEEAGAADAAQRAGAIVRRMLGNESA